MVMNHRVDLVSAIMKHVDPTALDACKLVSPVFYRAVKEYLRTVTPEDAWEMLVKNAHHYASLNSGVAKMVLARHIFRVALPQDYPTFYVRSVYAWTQSNGAPKLKCNKNGETTCRVERVCSKDSNACGFKIVANAPTTLYAMRC